MDRNARRNSRNNEIETRLKYVRAFNETMQRIWRDRIVRLGAIRSGALFRSVQSVKFLTNSEASEVEMQWGLAHYGPYVERATGSNTPLGNPGDIGRENLRTKKPFLSRPLYSSTMNLKEFLADSLDKEALQILSNAMENPPVLNLTL